jgi:hypothetical protein
VISGTKRGFQWLGDVMSTRPRYAAVPRDFEYPSQPDLQGTSLFDVDDDAE